MMNYWKPYKTLEEEKWLSLVVQNSVEFKLIKKIDICFNTNQGYMIKGTQTLTWWKKC
jgi:hypothetical protein